MMRRCELNRDAVIAILKGAGFKLRSASLDSLRAEGVSDAVLSKLQSLKDEQFDRQEAFLDEVKKRLSEDESRDLEERILNHAHLGVPGFEDAVVDEFFTETPGTAGTHFFKIEYEDGDVIMPKGVYSEYAGILLQGVIRVYDELPARARRLPTCWLRARPWLRRVMDGLRAWIARKDGAVRRFGAGVLRRREHDLAQPLPAGTRVGMARAAKEVAVIPARDEHGAVLPVLKRFVGITSVTWNQGRSVTLVAGNDPQTPTAKCQLLLIKRTALLELVNPQKNRQFYEGKLREFLGDELPRYLMDNRLFRYTFYVEEIEDPQWPVLLGVLRGARPPANGIDFGTIANYLNEPFRDRLPTLGAGPLDSTTKYQIVSQLNDLLKQPELPVQVEPGTALVPQAQELWARKQSDTKNLTRNELFCMHRLLFEAAFPDAVPRSTERCRPLTLADFQAFVQVIRDTAQGTLLPRECKEKPKKKDEPIYEEGTSSDALYFILRGQFRVTRRPASGQMLVNNLDDNGYFGESCLLEDAHGNPLPHRSTVAATTHGTLLRLDRAVVQKLCARELFPAFGRKLRQEIARMRSRDADPEAGRRLAPRDPPPEIAKELRVATNLLLIDMDRCVRCDQCVTTCAAAHEGVPRFHRANPQLSWGRWEVAAACVHCVNAPCQRACPVGAITFRDDPSRAVQLHRNRCIGCSACANACPFDVIEMYLPADIKKAKGSRSQDAPMLDLEKKEYDGTVATKCDLCLTNGSDPPCVVACPYDAAQRGSPKDLFPDFKGRAQFVTSP